MLITWALTLADSLHWLETTTLATVLAWIYVVLELPRLSPKQRKPIVALIAGGIVFTGLSSYTTGQLDLIALASEHLKLIMLLASVNFIRMATRLYGGSSSKGLPSFLATFTGMHLFSSVANFSSLMLVGDQVRRPRTEGQPDISPLSYVILTRAFALAIFWSPFLSMIPLLLHHVPGVEMSKVYPWSMAIVVFALVFTVLESRFRHHQELQQYNGYPMRPASLKLPAVMIVALLATHQLLPQLPMLVVVSIIAVLVPTLWMLLTHSPQQSVDKLKNHVKVVLPGARPEISLFLAAGFLAAAVKSSISAGLIPSPFEHTDALAATITMVAVFVIASLGIHQFALVAIFAGLLAQATTTPSLMALAYIVGVSLAMSGSVFSAVNFILHGQYQVRSRDVFRLNLPYSIAVLIFSTILLFVMEANGVQ
ncbi:hypothetical protein [Oceanobacter mangrovi]|uniref:hypothetical protein n=1 Tax=Oceanobacter mangrovi TaxID=2862510 RepID=UPI001C8E9EDB|nr:hypothetical protein [Oceanobacter mangrovi]